MGAMISTAPPQTQSAQTPLAVYIHWPFCKKKCPYCDFNSHVRETVDMAAWKDALLAELRYWHAQCPQHEVTSIFFGGGTPSLMHPSIAEALIAEVRQLWPVAHDLEITLEANPTSVESARFADLALAGVNRFSLGIQSLRPPALAFLGREHSVGEARAALDIAMRHARRVSFDLIYALPDQTEAAWQAELREALAIGTQHLSLYQLTIEENTAFHHAYHHQHAFCLPDDARAAALYQLTDATTRAAGLTAYEISNYAATGEASRHNLAYWRGHAYLGIGPGAHGRTLREGSRYATQNLKSPERWLSQTQAMQHGLEITQALTAGEAQEERLLMGLRLLDEGVMLSAELQKMLRNKIDMLAQHALLEMHGERLRVTAQGALVLNAITSELASALS